MLVSKIFKNPNILYILTRYGTYFVQLVNSILIASYMGPNYLAIWGAISLVIQYATQFNLGIPHAANTILSINKHHTKYINNVVGASFVLLFIINALISVGFVVLEYINPLFFQKYELGNYILSIIIIAVGLNCSSLLSNVYRVHNRLFEISFSQSILPVITLIFLFFYRGEQLLHNLVCAYAITTIVSCLIFVLRFPIKISWNFNTHLLGAIQKKGWNLFLYNSSFYLIMITSRTFVSIYYPVEEFGFFTFSFSLANIFVLILESFSFLIWPKLLNKLSKQDNEQALTSIENIRMVYITANNVLIYLGIAIIPFVLLFFKDYSTTKNAFITICIAQIIYSASYGFQGLLIAKGKESIVARISVLVLVLNIVLCFLFANVLHISYDLLILATAISYFVYVLMLSNRGLGLLSKSNNILDVFKISFGYATILPLLSCIVGVVCNFDFYWYCVPFLVFIILNFKNCKKIMSYANQIINNKDAFKI